MLHRSFQSTCYLFIALSLALSACAAPAILSGAPTTTVSTIVPTTAQIATAQPAASLAASSPTLSAPGNTPSAPPPTPTTVPTSTPRPVTLTTAPSSTATLVPTPAERCAPAPDGPLAGVDARRQRIVWWHTYTGGWEEGLQELVDQWNADNLCEITVELRNMGQASDLSDRMVQAIASQHGPSLTIGYQSDEANYYSLDGLVDLTPYVEDIYWGLEESDTADFYPAFWAQPLHDGLRLGIPFNRALEVMYYNLTWAAELGFNQAPTTPDEFEQQACAAAQANGDGTGGYVLRDNASAVAGWAFAFGGDFLNETGAAYTFNTPALQGSLAMLKRLYANGCAYFYTKGYPDPEFAARRALFTQGSSAGLYAYFNSLKKAKNDDQFAIIAPPYTSGTPRMNGYGIDLIVPVSTPEQQLAAWIFIKWFTAPLNQAEWARVTGYLPVRASALDYLGDYLAENPQWAQAAALLPYAVTEPSLASYTNVRSEIKKTFTKIIQGKSDNLEDLLEKLTEKANALGQ